MNKSKNNSKPELGISRLHPVLILLYNLKLTAALKHPSHFFNRNDHRASEKLRRNRNILQNQHISISGVKSESLQSLALTKTKCVETLSIEIISKSNFLPSRYFNFLLSWSDLRRVDMNFKGFGQIGLDTEKRSNLWTLFHKAAWIESIELNFKSTSIRDDDIRLISKNLVKNRNLKSFSLELSECQQISSEGIQLLSQIFLSRSVLNALRLYFHACPCITESSLDYLHKTFPKLAGTLKIFEIDLSQNSNTYINAQEIQNSEFYSGFTTALSTLKLLKSFSINFRGCKFFNENSFNCLAYSLKELKNLVKLDVNIYCDYPDREYIDLDLSNLEKLERISLTMPKVATNLTRDYKTLRESLENFSGLKSFTFDAKGLKSISGVGLAGIWQAINNYELENLSLIFLGLRYIEENDINTILMLIRNKISLKTLELEFFGMTVLSEKSVIHLAESLTYLTNLKKLRLHYGKTLCIKDKSIKNLSESLVYLKNLQTLNLHFGESGKSLPDESSTFLIKSIVKLTGLRTLILNFRDFKCFGDQSLSALTLLLSNLQKLSHFKLDLSFCQKFSNQEFIGLCISCLGLKHLEKFEMLLMDCNQLNIEAFQYLFSALKKIFSLRYLDLNLSGTTLDEKIQPFVEEMLLKLVYLEELKIEFDRCANLTPLANTLLKSLLNFQSC